MSATVETNVWGRILHSLKGRLNQQTLDTWFSPIQFESLDSSEHILHLRAPNQIVKDTVVGNYANLLADSLNDIHLSGYSVGWVIGKGSDWETETSATSDRSDIFPSTSVSTGGGAAAAVAVVKDVSPLQHPEPLLSSKY